MTLEEAIAARDAEPDKRKRRELSERVKLLRGVRQLERMIAASKEAPAKP